jgi:quinol monooxygenase YgiN
MSSRASRSVWVGENTGLTLTSKLATQAGKGQEFETKTRLVMPKAQEEPENYAYSMHRSQDNPRVFVAYEEYAD